MIRQSVLNSAAYSIKDLRNVNLVLKQVQAHGSEWPYIPQELQE